MPSKADVSNVTYFGSFDCIANVFFLRYSQSYIHNYISARV